MSHPSLRKTLLITAIALAAAYSLALAFDWPDWIHGVNWVWVRRVPLLLAQRWGWLAVLLALAGLGWRWVGRDEGWNGRHQTILLLSIIIATPAAQLIFASLHSAQPLLVPLSMESGFFHEGVRLEEPLTLLQTHLAEMPNYRDVHLQTQPPGWILTYWAASQIWSRFPTAADNVGLRLLRYDCLDFELQGLTAAQLAAGSLPLLIVLFSGLGALPFYGLGRRFLGERLARRALILYPFWPGLLVFTGRFDGLYALLALLALWLAQAVFAEPMASKGKAIAFGGVLALSTWFGFGVLGIVLLVNGVLAVQLVLGIVPWRRGLGRLAALDGSFGGGLLLVWGVPWLLWGVNGVAMFAASQTLHAKLRLSYPAWFLFNWFDLAVFMGIVLLIGAVIGAVTAVSRLHPSSFTLHPSSGAALTLGWLAVALLLNLSGQVRAETGRLWLLLMGPGMLAGLWGWQRLFKGERRWETAVFIAFLGQAVVTAVLLGGRMAPASVPPPVWDVPAEAAPLDYQLGDTLALQGYAVRQEADMLVVDLYWRALDFPRGDYSVLTHLVADDGTIITQSDGGPRNGELPTWCWIPGEVVQDERSVALSEVGERPFHILVGMYDWRTGQRLPVTPTVPNDAIPLE
ncbi:MAG: hypothetical protein H6662_05755 [Ardenticatenaceae bacterium]|nr:hypothetical protein [Anaerolineales bacterium]MCB8921069.1 hypothetical protein [Ardenticatenaceae bacterium]MCB8991167.1 hypothetical protein [Ardenticatenaceae bacterium]MCB9005375.1 hypothetical protein [Ardenticatenaceae bacterium]